MQTEVVERSSRVAGVDVARGLAVVAMIQTHAYDGWVEPAQRSTLGFAVTRFIGVLPLPLFLLLAGLSLRLRAEALAARGADVSAQRRAAIRSGLEVVLWGYALNLAYGLMDGARGFDTWLRADVLHVIGLSLAVLAFAAVGRPWSLGRAGWLAALGVTLACVPLSRLALEVAGPWRYVLAPFIAVPGVGIMPMVPLLAWCGLGAAIGAALVDERGRFRRAITIGAITLAAALAFRWLVAHGVVAARTHPIVALNVVDLGGRGALVILLCCWLSGLPGARRLVAPLTVMGRHSLFIYGLHIPFCYGLPGRALRRALDMKMATLAVILLIVAMWAAARLWDMRARRR